MANYNFIYQGSTSPLEPEGDIIDSEKIPMSELSSSLDPRTANQLKIASQHFNTGEQNIEVQGVSPEIMESMPKEHLKEINRLTKVTGTEASLHAPMIDPSGLTQNGWDEMNQKAAEKQLWSAVERSHDLNPEGNVPVTFHASTVPLPPAEFKVKEEGKEKIKSVLLITPDGRLEQIKERERFLEEEGKKFEPEKETKRRNKELWDQQLANMNFYAQKGTEIIREVQGPGMPAKLRELTERKDWEKIKQEHPLLGKEVEKFQIPEEEKQRLRNHGEIFLKDSYRNLREMFDLVYKNAPSKDKEKLMVYAQKVRENADLIESPEKTQEQLTKFSEIIEQGVKTFKGITQPNILMPLRDFAIEKSSETVANLALKSYKKFGNSAPFISLENHPAQTSTLTRAEDLRDVIEAARKKFIENAKAEGYSSGDAKAQAEKLIGATWDVGHINMLRRYGYEKKDIIEETKKIAPFVKHVHLSDNFGFEHTELPMGMGNVPIKEIMKKLGKEGFKGKKVIEAASWWQHFSEQGKISPFPLTAKAFGSPIYGMYMASSWSTPGVIGATGEYFIGQGAINPPIHHALYGAGFATLPKELGGEIPGGTQRTTGTPMA